MRSIGHEYDACVIGGGPAGAVTALMLARAGRSILVVDRGATGEVKIGETVPPGINPVLREFSLSESFLSNDHLPCYGNRSAWGSPTLSDTDFMFSASGHGWHLDRGRFDRMLLDAAEKAGADVARGASLLTVERRFSDEWSLGLQLHAADGHEIRCRFVVDASGRSRRFSRDRGVAARRHDRLVAFATFWTADPRREDHDSRTLIESTSDGWWYTARIPGGRRVVARFVDAGSPSSGAARNAAGYRHDLDATTHVREHVLARGYSQETAPFAYPANSYILQEPVGDGWLATGDAAGAFDPLSSQGILTAMRLGERAAECVGAYLSGDVAALHTYEDAIAVGYEEYLATRRHVYSAETRWRDSPFWRSRRD